VLYKCTYLLEKKFFPLNENILVIEIDETKVRKDFDDNNFNSSLQNYVAPVAPRPGYLVSPKIDALTKSACRDKSSLGQSFGFISGIYMQKMPPDKIPPMGIFFRRIGDIEK
jgi:hypothetical protein